MAECSVPDCSNTPEVRHPNGSICERCARIIVVAGWYGLTADAQS